MFERFSDEARRAIVRGLAEARMLGHDYVGTEHVVVALAADSAALRDAGVDVERARAAAADVAAANFVPALRDDGPYTRRLSLAFDNARRQALMHGYRRISNGHLLMGILRLGEGNGIMLLKQLDVEIEALRQIVEEQLQADIAPRPLAEHGPSLTAGLPLRIASSTVEDRMPAPAPAPAVGVEAPGSGRSCSFCGCVVDDAARFVASRTAVICAGCASACVQLLGERAAD